jgi:hypothetical protein
MSVANLPEGELRIGPPRSKPWAATELRAEMDLLAGLMACSAKRSNNSKFKTIEYEISPHYVG